MSPTSFYVHGHRIASGSGFSALVGTATDGADVSISPCTVASVPESPPAGRMLFHSPHDWPVFITDSGADYTMRYAGHVDYRFTAALDAIDCVVADRADLAFAEAITQGAVLSALMSLRGKLSLHASSLDLDGDRVAIFGPSGLGKSTTAAKLLAAGATLVSDDVVVVERAPGFETSPGLLGLRLRADATDLAELIPGISTYESVDKRLVVRQHREPDRRPRPLAALFTPQRSAKVKRAFAEQVRPGNALSLLLPAARLIGWQDESVLADEFHQLVALAASVPVFVLHLPTDTPSGDVMAVADVVRDAMDLPGVVA